LKTQPCWANLKYTEKPLVASQPRCFNVMLLEEYKNAWAKDFAIIKKVIEQSLIPASISIEHIGSTSVPDLSAKPIIDIDIVYETEKNFADIKSGLEQLGYYHNGNQGITDREVFKRRIDSNKHETLDFIPHHLYVCSTNSEELQKHILFRDYLIANEEARFQYQQIKVELAAEANQDRKKYAALKELKATGLINSIVDKLKTNNTKNF